MRKIEELVQDLHSVEKRDGRLVPFKKENILNAILKAATAEADKEGKPVDTAEAERITEVVIEKLYDQKLQGEFPVSKKNVPHREDIQNTVEETLKLTGHIKTANAYHSYREQRLLDSKKIGIEPVKKNIDLTNRALLVYSESQEELLSWDKARVAKALMKEVEMREPQAYSIAKEVEKRVFDWVNKRIIYRNNSADKIRIKTSKIREIANEVIEDLGLEHKLRESDVITIPAYDLFALMTGKNLENANVVANNPEAVSSNFGEDGIKMFMLGNVFSRKVADAHLEGRVHLHDLGYGPRVYCSSHSLVNVLKWGLNLLNLSTSSSPAHHARTGIGHLNTFLASMQAYYAGALGVSYVNDSLAPHLNSDANEIRKSRFMYEKMHEDMMNNFDSVVKNKDMAEQQKKILQQNFEEIMRNYKSDMEIAVKKEIKQDAQFAIYSGSQMAFSRGGQTLFLDFNIHSGTPKAIRDNPAIGPEGKYQLRDLNTNVLVPLEEQVREEDGKLLSTLFHNGRMVMDETIEKKDGKIFLKRHYSTKDTEKVDTYGDNEEMARMFGYALLDIYRKGDQNGIPFPFPKCDFHVTQESFSDPEQNKMLKYVCQISSENGAPYFVFDREATTLSACCRLRTTVEDDYMLKHIESLRFCGFQNVSINLPQAALRAGKGNIEGFVANIKHAMDLGIQAHQEKKKFIGLLGDRGGAQYQTQSLWFDRKKYVDLETATYILGLVGMNEAVQYITGKEMHETGESLRFAHRVTAEMFAHIQNRGKETGLKLTLEESPAESTSGRFAKLDLQHYNDAKTIYKGTEKHPYYTNSIHLRADAPVDFITRIKSQSKFHDMIESGAIIHAFTKDSRPSAENIYKLVEHTWYNTQAAQLTMSPEITYCEDCKKTSPGIRLKK